MAINETTPLEKRWLLYGGLGLGLGVLAALMLIKLTLPYYLLLVGAVLFFLLLYNHIEFGIGFLIASMLFEKPLLPGEIELSLTRILSLPVLIVCFVKIVLDQKKLIFDKYKDSMVLLLLVWMVSGLLFAADLESVTTGLLTLVQLVFMYFVFKTIIDDETSLQKVIKITVIASLCIAGFTVITILSDPDSLVYATKMTWSDRVTGSANDPNKFAMGLIFIVPLSIYLFLTKSRWFLLAVLLFYFLILTTFSRGGYVALLIITLLSLIYFIRHTKRGVLYSTVLLIMFAGSFAFLNQGNKITDRMQTLQNYDSGSIGTRLELAEVAVDMGIHNPAFGVGLHNFRANSQFYGNQQHYERDAHNGYLEVFATLGVPGFLLLMGLIYLSFRDINRFQNTLDAGSGRDAALITLAKFLKISLIGYLVAAFFLTLIGQKLFWTMLAFSSLLYKFTELRERKNPLPRNRPEPVVSVKKIQEHMLN